MCKGCKICPGDAFQIFHEIKKQDAENGAQASSKSSLGEISLPQLKQDMHAHRIWVESGPASLADAGSVQAAQRVLAKDQAARWVLD